MQIAATAAAVILCVTSHREASVGHQQSCLCGSFCTGPSWTPKSVRGFQQPTDKRFVSRHVSHVSPTLLFLFPSYKNVSFLNPARLKRPALSNFPKHLHFVKTCPVSKNLPLFRNYFFSECCHG